ncbi:guanine deaminase [Aquitalea palustris]|uniref:Guanine deaminase n=1 Tax=Aquitalea palustris TaxID=2480983 RepID=A0A454JI30_9NEIS|nr:guanine deaminase [Aquitalea palustris]RMC97123.1 guanine deaminase [Aquitalea palustris]
MKTAVRAAMISFRADPFLLPVAECLHYDSDALIIMEDGKISALGPAANLLPDLAADVPLQHFPHGVLLPGFIDCHVHYAQTEMMAAFGAQLIDWLNDYTFVTEQGFAEGEHAREVARLFLQEQLRNGVTTACVFGTVHPHSVDVLFEEAARYGLRLIAGKVCMDRHAPAALLDSAQAAYDDSLALIRRWHGRGRAEYALTPRFAPSCSPAQLDALAALARDYPDVLIQSHVAENLDELAWVQRLFPHCRDYTDVYDRHGLLRPRAVFGHGIHLSDAEIAAFADSGAALAHCPTSNQFLGSGSLDLRRLKQGTRQVALGLGTDVGAGTSFSMLHTMQAAYMAAQSHGNALTAVQAWYLATRGAATALGIADKVGSLAPGMEADLLVLDWHSTPLITFRMRYARDVQDALFIQMMLGDDRAIAATYVAGRLVYQRAADSGN